MDLQLLWFCLIAILWAGYFLLEGFDFGVGMLLPFLPEGEEDRRTMLRTIGPVWDGNEVWLVVAGGATFAAFPAWYATMFSGFYVALLLVLFFLIIRVVSFEWRSKSETPGWRAFWTWCNTVGSAGAALIWGVGLSCLVYGVPINSSGDYAGNFWDLFSPYTVFAGVAVVVLFAFHGATFLTLRTVGELRDRAEHAARRLALPAVVLAADLPDLDGRRRDGPKRQGPVPPVLPGRARDRGARPGAHLPLQRSERTTFRRRASARSASSPRSS